MSMPEMTAVQSSNIESIGYDVANETVYVRFLNGGLYIYKGVSLSEYEGLFSAPSVGSHLHRYFKNVYQYEKIG